jgi:hypothetical protein
MRWLLFFSRVAFVCGIFFLLTVSLQFRNWAKDDALVSTIFIIGYFLGLIIIPLVNIACLASAIMKKNPLLHIPKWLIVANALFLAGQLYYIFLLNR